MNMTPVAQAVQRQGRGRDTMLVHMTPGEVGGLQALAMAHGGSLSINPKTGLPEAGFLENILPTLLGIGGTFLGIPPHITAMAVGGLETARTGDIGKGFLAGLGAFGGANIGTALGSAGAQQGVQAATAAGADLTAQTGTLAAENARDALLMRGAETLPSSVAALPTPTGVPPTFMQNAAQAGQGFKNIFASGDVGTAARDAFMGNIGGYSGLASDVGSVAAPALLAQPKVETVKPEKSTYKGPYTPAPREVRFPTAEQRQGLGTSEFQYFTDVNPVPGFQPFSATQTTQAAPTTSGLSAPVATPTMAEEERLRMAGLSTPMRMKDGGVPMLEDGGFVLTKKAVDGLGRGSNKKGQRVASAGLGAIPIKGAGAKRGPKAGVDDKIKTTIEGKRPALVSNGEAYVPKKQVAKRGGAKAFYALMSKAEKQAKQAKRT